MLYWACDRWETKSVFKFEQNNIIIFIHRNTFFSFLCHRKVTIAKLQLFLEVNITFAGKKETAMQDIYKIK